MVGIVVGFIVGLDMGNGTLDAMVFTWLLGIALVPEGLVVTMIVSLTLIAQRIFMKYLLVKSVESVEVLGSTSCICIDKTGTLTVNDLVMSQLFINR